MPHFPSQPSLSAFRLEYDLTGLSAVLSSHRQHLLSLANSHFTRICAFAVLTGMFSGTGTTKASYNCPRKKKTKSRRVQCSQSSFGLNGSGIVFQKWWCSNLWRV